MWRRREDAVGNQEFKEGVAQVARRGGVRHPKGFGMGVSAAKLEHMCGHGHRNRRNDSRKIVPESRCFHEKEPLLLRN